MSVPVIPGDQLQAQAGRVKVVAGYALQQRLGSGSFATVYKGVRVPNTEDESTNDSSAPEVVAVKAIGRTSEKLTKKVLSSLEMEISILRTYRHPNIVCMHNVQKTERHFYLVLEYCGGGDVQRLIRTRKTGRLSERLTRRLMRDLAAGLKFLWGQELIHRDIKPQNLLLTGALPLDEVNDPDNTYEEEARRRQINYPSEQFCLKIADFGFARHLQTASLAETLCGSPLYMAPEILQHHRYDAKADLWSVGTVLFEMISGKPPFNGENHIDLLRNIQRKAVRLPPDVRVSKACVALLRGLLNRNPLSRANFKEFFEACDTFVSLGCEGVATQDVGTCRITQTDLGTIHENEGAAPSPSPGSESLMTVNTTAQPNQRQTQPTAVHEMTPNPVVSPPFTPMVTPSALIPNQQGLVRNYPSRLSPLTQSPPSFSTPYSNTRIQTMVPLSLNNQGIPPWQQPATLSTELTQTNRRNEMSQSQASVDGDSGFVMVEHGANSRSGPYDQSDSIPNSNRGIMHAGPYYANTHPPIPGKTDFGMNERRSSSKGMLSTSPGTGGLLMGLVGRARLGYEAPDANRNDTRLVDEIAAVNKMLATAEDVGRRAVSVAHLGDTRAYLGMRLAYMNEEGSSVLSGTPMEGVEEEPAENRSHGGLTDDSSSTEIMAPTRRRSSVSADKMMTDTRLEEDQCEEMPFAISPEAPSVALPTRQNSTGFNSRGTGTSSVKKQIGRSHPNIIRCHFGEALSCYLKALKMLKSAVGAAQRVSKDLETMMTQVGRSPTQYDIPKIQNHCQVTTTWLGGQFQGVLERADAANIEISKLSQIVEGKELEPVTSVEELIYNHALAAGRDGAVKQLLGQYDAARMCYRSAGLLAETLLMENSIGEDDKKILEGYVDGFAAKITELDQLMLHQSRMTGSSNPGSVPRGSGIVGLIGPPASAPSGFLVGTPR